MSTSQPQAPEPAASNRKQYLSWSLLRLLLFIAVLFGGSASMLLGCDAQPLPAPTPTSLATAPFTATANTTTVVNPTSETVAGTPSISADAGVSPTANPQKPLEGRRIGIDPGHGPREDLGAVYINPDTGRVALTEADFNLDVALRCRDLLVARGADVVLTRVTTDTFTIPWPNDANGDGTIGASGDELQSRIDILNSFGAEVFLSIHSNSSREPGNGDDLQVLYCGSGDCPFPTQSKQLGRNVLAQLNTRLEASGYSVRGGSLVDDLTIDDTGLHMFILGPASPPRHVRAITMPGVIGETLYITLPAGAKQLMSDNIRQAIALGYADALQEYLMSTSK